MSILPEVVCVCVCVCVGVVPTLTKIVKANRYIKLTSEFCLI